MFDSDAYLLKHQDRLRREIATLEAKGDLTVFEQGSLRQYRDKLAELESLDVN